MSLYTLPRSLSVKVIGPYKNVVPECGCSRLNGTLSSTSITDGPNRKEEKTEKTTSASDSTSEKNSTTEAVADRRFTFQIKLSSLGNHVPLKIAEMNRFVAKASKKLLKASQDVTGTISRTNGNSKSNSNSSGSSDKDEVDSLEQSISKTNQSILSFYDTSFANNTTNQRPLHDQSGSAINDEEANEPRAIGPLFPVVATEAKKKKTAERRAEKISRLSLESRTKSLVQALKTSHSLMSKLTRLEELCDHLTLHPECVMDADKENVAPCLMRLTNAFDKNLKGMAYQCLSLLGYAKPLTSPGIRILAIDGGGTRGLVTIEFLKALEKQTGKRVYELFDYVCGVSTGALLAAMICLYKLPLDRCEDLYRDCSVQTFTRNRVLGTTQLVWNHGFYDSKSWEEILKKEMGAKPLIEFSRDPSLPKLAAVSSLIRAPGMVNYLFRTYNPPPGMMSQYPGSCRYKMWEVIRASSAAPGYFEPFQLDGAVHEDGGILTNNPTALAIHESKLLWSTEDLHCVVSLGTGRFEKNISEKPTKLSLKRKLSSIVDSATDTEAVHHTLQDLLPARTYFRFNPYLSEEFFLDEIRPEKMAQMQHDARMYTRRNSFKLTAVSERLVQKRKPQQLVGDWMGQMKSKLQLPRH